MTKFENLLIDKGYVKNVFNCKTMKYEPVDSHIISTMTNLDHRYIHKNHKVIICFGLNERGKPPTLISPRPKIIVKSYINDKLVLRDEKLDDCMNLVLLNEDLNLVYDSLFDKSICFNYDLK